MRKLENELTLKKQNPLNLIMVRNSIDLTEQPKERRNKAA